MISAIDTNVIVALWDADEPDHLTALSMLGVAGSLGGLVICGAVYGELLAGPGRTQDFIDVFLEDSEILVDWSSSETIWQTTASLFRNTPRASGGKNTASRAAFLQIFTLARALCNGYRLLTLDEEIYRAAFPRLSLVKA
jgi:predicted nucleic acid-binding protein